MLYKPASLFTAEDDVFAAAGKQFNGTGSYGNGSAMRVAPVALYTFGYDFPLTSVCTRALVFHVYVSGVFLRYAPRVFLQCSQGISTICPGYFYNAPGVFLQYAQGISTMLPGYFTICLGYFYNAPRVLLRYAQVISTMLPGYYYDMPRVFLQCYRGMSAI